MLSKLILIGILLTTPCFAAVNNIIEEDGSPSAYPWRLKFPNGTMTDNLDGTVSLAAGLGGVTGS